MRQLTAKNSHGNMINFVEEQVLPNGDCGFIALGTNRKHLTEILLEVADDTDIREFIWEDIARVLLTKKLILPIPRERREYQRQVNLYNRNNNALDVKKYCNSKNVFIFVS